MMHRALMVAYTALVALGVVATFWKASKQPSASAAVRLVTFGLLMDALMVYVLVRAW